jgi:spermidine synthase
VSPPLIGSWALRLLLVGAATLFWELVLIRWLGACVRIVAYYSNFVLIGAFFGLGCGALLARSRIQLRKLVFPAIAASLLLGVLLSGFQHLNPLTPDEYVWIGSAPGISVSQQAGHWLSLWLVLPPVYLCSAFVFVVFGQWIGILMSERPTPLLAYSVEVLGSVLGIALFALLSYLETTPLVWFGVGFGVLLLVVERSRASYAVAGVCCLLVLVGTAPQVRQFVWSPYYKIYVEPLSQIHDTAHDRPVALSGSMGHTLTVNNDYHQMMLDLGPREEEHAFFSSWRELYDAPYHDAAGLPPGPVLVVGAGTGNDVAAALRRTDRHVHAVEIDPAILRLGLDLHPERPYSDPRVTLWVDDARSFFQSTDERFALVVFGFLDSHTLLSSFSSVRLDNFVYTLESFERVKSILLPGGRVAVTFASNRAFIHERMLALLDRVYGGPTGVFTGSVEPRYANGTLYVASNRGPDPPRSAEASERPSRRPLVPEDDWPFLYLRGRGIPSHYWPFLTTIVALACASLLLLPRGERRLRLPYFFLGAGFFLIETSNVVSLSLLYGSTWSVNALVFGGVLVLVLLGNLTVHRLHVATITPWFGLLALSVLLAYVAEPSWLLDLESGPLRAAGAVAVFLGPVYFAAVIFATLIKNEARLFEAYGSNTLGAVLGGACEYLSTLVGFKALLAVTLVFYLGAFLFSRRQG